MGPKKQAKKGSKEEDEDLSTLELLNLYKKNCKNQGIPFSKKIENQINEKIDDSTNLQELLIDEKIGEEGLIEFCKALKMVNKNEGYKHLQSIRVWEGNINNQGIRAIYTYINEKKNYKINLLEFINCNISELGCEFLSRLFNPLSAFNIKILILDYNNFGDKGLMQLSTTIKINNSINYFSLSYCGISENGINYLKNIFDNDKNEIEYVSLQGNNIGNKGISEFLSLLSEKNNNYLEEINFNNTNIGNNQNFINSLLNALNSNKTLCTFSLKFNLISNYEFKCILDILQEQKKKNDFHIYQLLIDEIYEENDYKLLFDILKSRKKPKKKRINKK